MGARREHQNKAERVVSRETAGASGRLTQLTSLTSLTGTKASAPLRVCHFLSSFLQNAEPEGKRETSYF